MGSRRPQFNSPFRNPVIAAASATRRAGLIYGNAPSSLITAAPCSRNQEEQASSQAAKKRDQVKGGGRAEKIRTYNFKENRVTDHRIGVTLYKLERVLAGDLDGVVEPLMIHEREQQLEAGNGEA